MPPRCLPGGPVVPAVLSCFLLLTVPFVQSQAAPESRQLRSVPESATEAAQAMEGDVEKAEAPETPEPKPDEDPDKAATAKTPPSGPDEETDGSATAENTPGLARSVPRPKAEVQAPKPADDAAADAPGETERADRGPAPVPKPQSDHLPPPKPDLLAGLKPQDEVGTADPSSVPEPAPDAPVTPKPDDLFAKAEPELPLGQPKRPIACSIEGAEIERVEQPKPDVPACMVPVPVEVSALSVPQEVDLRPNAVVDCQLASSFSGWVRDVVAPAAVRYLGSPLKGLRIAASFHCRRRNNLDTGKISEHAKGNAIDIAAFRLEDGRLVTVADGWKGKGKEKDFLMHVRKEACDRFLTVLSPEGDAYHQDHMHLDQGCHGKTCTYRICH